MKQKSFIIKLFFCAAFLLAVILPSTIVAEYNDTTQYSMPQNPPLPPVGVVPATPSLLRKGTCVRWDHRCNMLPDCAQWSNFANDDCFYCKKPHVHGKVICTPQALNQVAAAGYACARTYHYQSNRPSGFCLRWNKKEVCHRQCMQWGTL